MQRHPRLSIAKMAAHHRRPIREDSMLGIRVTTI